MDHQDLKLKRRPLLTLGQTEDDLDEGIREPHKADRLTNRLRQISDRLSVGRTFNRAAYNRRQRHLYKARPPQQAGQTSEKRLAPMKHLGVRLRSR